MGNFRFEPQTVAPGNRGFSPGGRRRTTGLEAAYERHMAIRGHPMGPHSMLDEGIDRVLDRLQGECGINSLLVYSHTYYTSHGIRRKRKANVLAQDHGCPPAI